jgi:3-oxoacyl-(acyl-carrier-protein) synthase
VRYFFALRLCFFFQAIYSLIMMNEGFLAESANIKDLVDEAKDMKILTARHEGAVSRVMSNSFGFGGTNCCLIFDKYTDERPAPGVFTRNLV